MKFYTFFTESHKELFNDYFIKTFPFDQRMELIVQYRKQVGDGEFSSVEIKSMWTAKVDCMLSALNEAKGGEYVVYSDADIQFFGDIYGDLLLEIKDHEMAFQNDYKGGICAGFFIMKSTYKTRSFIKKVRRYVEGFHTDQACMNQLLYEKGAPKWKILSKKYWNYGEIACQEKNSDSGNFLWDGQHDFEIPKDIVIHHANWTKNLKGKKDLMDLVKIKFNERKSK
jgi:hypothetical protein